MHVKRSDPTSFSGSDSKLDYYTKNYTRATATFNMKYRLLITLK